MLLLRQLHLCECSFKVLAIGTCKMCHVCFRGWFLFLAKFLLARLRLMLKIPIVLDVERCYVLYSKSCTIEDLIVARWYNMLTGYRRFGGYQPGRSIRVCYLLSWHSMKFVNTWEFHMLYYTFVVRDGMCWYHMDFLGLCSMRANCVCGFIMCSCSFRDS